jgi:hypothetical protein
MEDANLGQPETAAPAPAPVAPATMPAEVASTGKSSWLTWLLVIVVLAVVAYGIWFFLKK